MDEVAKAVNLDDAKAKKELQKVEQEQRMIKNSH